MVFRALTQMNTFHMHSLTSPKLYGIIGYTYKVVLFSVKLVALIL